MSGSQNVISFVVESTIVESQKEYDLDLDVLSLMASADHPVLPSLEFAALLAAQDGPYECCGL